MAQRPGAAMSGDNQVKRLTLFTLLATSAISFSALAAPQHVRGTVASTSQGSLVVHSEQGKDLTVALTDKTKYATVHKSSLSEVGKGDYIGTATKGSGSFLVALELVIFPQSMRGAGEGHYDWDKLPDTTLSGKGATSSKMTNGTIESASAATGKEVNSAMTNGTVETANEKSGAKQITVSYKGGKQTILVPPTAPIVKLEPAEMSAVKSGDHVFVSASENEGKVTAGFVAVGVDGVTPPM